MSSAVGGSPIQAKQQSVHSKKRPRVFGFTKKVSSEETSSPVAVPTATGKKLALPMLCTSSAECLVSSPAIDRACESDSLCEMKGLWLIDLEELLASVTRRASCNICGSGPTLRENLGIRSGVCSKLTLSCTNPLCTGKEDALSDPYVHSKAWNTRFILVGRMCGKVGAGLETICEVMDLPPPVRPKSYSLHNNILHQFVQNVRMGSSKVASVQLHRLQGADPNETINVIFTCGGSWFHRGFVAPYGMVAVISWETGHVLDMTVLSKSCKEAESTMCSKSEEFLEWMAKHQDSCNSNYTGSSPGREAEGASILWARSVEKHKLRYTVVISDGDTKTISSEYPYGTDIDIQVSTFMLILFILWWISKLSTFMVITYLFTFMVINIFVYIW